MNTETELHAEAIRLLKRRTKLQLEIREIEARLAAIDKELAQAKAQGSG